MTESRWILYECFPPGGAEGRGKGQAPTRVAVKRVATGAHCPPPRESPCLSPASGQLTLLAAHEHQQGDHPAVLGNEHVVGAAGSVAAHHFEAAADAGQSDHDLGAGKTVRVAGADEENLGVEFRYVREYSGIDVLESLNALARLESTR